MRLRSYGKSYAMAWTCLGTLVLSSGPGNILAAAAASAAPAPAAASALRVARVDGQMIRIDTSALEGQRGRILMRVPTDRTPAHVVEVRWTAQFALADGVARPGQRAVVADRVTLGQTIQDVLTFEVRSNAATAGRIELVPEFEFEGTGGQLRRLPAVDATGAPLRIVLDRAELVPGGSPAERWSVRTPETERMPAALQVTGSGVRVQHDFARTRVSLSPEVTDQYGMAFKAAVGHAFSNRLALGLVGGGGKGHRDVVFNAGVQVTPSQRLLVTAGTLSQHMDLPFSTGFEPTRMTQTSGGAAYRVAFGGRLQPRLDTQGYFAHSGSRDLGAVYFFKDENGQAQVYQQERRVAGALLSGAQTRASASLVPGGTVTVSVGAEQLRYDFAAGDETTRSVTRGLEWAQRVPGGLSLHGYARTQTAMHTLGLRTERSFRSYGQRLGVDVTRIDGRNGVMDDLRLRVTHSFTFGTGSRPAAQRLADIDRGLAAPMSGLISEVTERPMFLPLVPLAKVDHTLQPQRLVAIDHDGMVDGTQIDSTNGTVTVPTAAVEITGITRNEAPFTNSGQFSMLNGDLQIHPLQMAEPAEDGDEYIVTLLRASGAVTTVTVEVVRGSIRIVRVTVVADDDPNTTPDAFSFAAAGDAAPNALVTSEAVTVTGLEAAATISITGGEYSIDGGPFTSAPGTISNGQVVVVRVQAPAAYGATATAVLTIGGVSATFSVTAEDEPESGTPNAFSFTAQTGVARDEMVASNLITVSGINIPTAISVTGGEYSVNGGAWTTSAGTVENGDQVQVQRMSSAAFSTLTSATLTIGGVSAAFNVTTEAANTTPTVFSFTAQTGVARSTSVQSNTITVAGIDAAAAVSIAGGEYSVNGGSWTASAGTVENGDEVQVQLMSSAVFSTPASATLTIGGVSAAFEVTTEAAVTTPAAFSFTAQTDVARSTTVASSTVTVSGINAPAAVSITGGEYRVNGGAWTASAGTVENGDEVQVQLTSSAAFSTPASATLTIGGVSAAFEVTTEAAVTTPTAFSFTAQTGVARSTTVTSNTITVHGINAPAAVSITGGEYSVNGGSWTASAGTVENGDEVQVQLTSSADFSTLATATLTIGGASAAFNVTTEAADTTPDAFSFTAQTGAVPNTAVVSNAITVSGINAPAAISITGGEYRVNGGGWTASASTVENGDTVEVQVMSSASPDVMTTATLTIGGVAAAFNVTTAPGHTPDAFSFETKTNVNPNTTQQSESVTITGISAGTLISVVNGEYKKNNNPWTDVAGTINPGDTVQVRHTSATGSLASKTTTLTIGTVSATFTTVTKP